MGKALAKLERIIYNIHIEGGKIKNNFLIVVLGFSFVLFTSLFSVSRAAEGEDITISANTTWEAGEYTYQDITVTNNAILTLNGAYSSDTNGTGVVINARNITVDSGAQISANGKGYAANAGTGKGGIYSAYGGGGSHAGRGGQPAVAVTNGAVYGSATDPLTLGSGGGNGGAGGGAISLNLTGNLSVSGSIFAKGSNGGSNTGGGAGGSIKISAVNVSGSGSISSNGGNGGGGGGGGGGGRVAIYHTGTQSIPSANISAAGGTGANAGTIGSIIVYDRTSKDCTITSDVFIDPNMGINSEGFPSTDGIFNFRNLTINNNAVLYNGTKYSTDSDGIGVELRLTGDLTVASGSRIDGKGRGYPLGVGEGKPTGTGNTYGGGGGHGGSGGRGEAGVGGARYDSTLFPIRPGSSGYTTRGGVGGAAIKITAVDIVLEGSIDQSSSNATLGGATHGAGGAGGSIYIVSSTVSGAGTIKADGSNGTGSSGGGGGGRIAIYSNTTGLNSENITANLGTKGGGGYSADGVVGTVFLYDTASGNVSASSDVSFEANQGVNRDGTLRTDGVFYFNNLTVSDNATVTIGGYYTNDTDGRGVTLNLDGNLTVESGSKISASAQGYAGNAGQGKGTGTASTSGSGGSYGGLGGKSYNNNLASAVYDLTKANFPSSLGSGGGSGTGVGGKGGGAIALRVLGGVVNNGEIIADGASGTGGISAWKPGGGSGGSVFINCDSLTGSGIITAKGGDGLGSADYGSGGGGGGRISVVYSSSQTLPLANFSAAGGVGGGSTDRAGAEGSVNITQRILPAAEFALKNPNNDSTEFTNTENVEIVPADEAVEKYKEAASPSELVPTFYAEGWANVQDGKDLSASEGEKTVRAWFKDGNELISSSIGSATITLDVTSPEVEILNNNQTVSADTATIQFTLSDNLSGIDYIVVDGQTIDVATLSVKSVAKSSSIKAYADETAFETTVNLAEGENSIPVVVYDKAGNSTENTIIATRSTPAVDTPTPTPSDEDSATPSPSAEQSQSTAAGSESATATSGLSETASLTSSRPGQTESSISSAIGSVGDSLSNIFSNEQNTAPDRSFNQESDNSGANNSDWYKYVAILALLVVGWFLIKKFKKS